MPQEISKCFTPEWCQFIRNNAEAFAELEPKILTKDGLLPCSNLILHKGNRSYTLWLRDHYDISVAPNPYASLVTDYISRDPQLWNASAIRVIPNRTIYNRIPMYGVSFTKAIKKAFQEGFMKCIFYLPEKMGDVYYAALLFHINKRKESNKSMLELQVWQYCPDQTEVFYLHAESPDFNNHITHLDGAIIHFTPDEIKQLFRSGNKIKSHQYEKQFRIDGNISFQDMLKIVSAYLPVTELVDEAFEIVDLTTHSA